MVRFALLSFVGLVIVALVTAWVSRRVGTEQAIDDATNVAFVTGHGIVEPALTPDVLAGDPAALDRLDAAVRQYALQGSLVRVKIWEADGTILYSDEPRLIGERFELPDDKQSVFLSGQPHAEVSDLEGPENRFELDQALLEVYQRINAEDGTPLLFETYFQLESVNDSGRSLWGQFAPISIGALVALQLVQLPFAWGMARRLRAGEEERVRLLRRAIAASEAERRRIASDLHDGVVQDLTGVSLTLAALGNRNDVTPDQLHDASANVRASVKALRSLLVEIYPPNLREEGLETAVGDLLNAASARGVEAHLDADISDRDISDDARILAYRVVQEALRNVLAHSKASSVHVRIRLDDEIEVAIDDNGQGFDDEALRSSTDRGHVGLRTLAGVLTDAGGQFRVLSAPSAGTRIEARIPVNVEVPS